MTRYLGIDYGTKRIGLAVSDAETDIASPLTAIDARGSVAAQAKAVAEIATDYVADAFVVGLPLNMDDTEGRQAELTRAFGDELAYLTDLPVHYHDERLSSLWADELLAPAELTRKKKKRHLDPVAAQVMLQDFLDKRARQSGSDGP
ncbi:MAG: Holliday junction resolvase RuvX [Planctomycetota bacterium]|jgi:putative Holliday junction resolvase